MAVMLASKPATATQYYSWAPSLVEGDSISSFTLTENGVTVEESSNAGDELRLYISGGTSGDVEDIGVSLLTGYGETLVETLYIPITGPGNSFSYTADQVVDFALRPIRGLLGSRTANETADALEHLNDMLGEWAGQGADLGIPLPLVAGDLLYCSDASVRAVKNNLRVKVAEQYGRQVSPSTARDALLGLQQIKFTILRDREPATAEFY